MSINWMQILFQLINFGIVAFVLIKFLYKPITSVLQARSEKIKSGLDAAEKSLTAQSKLETQVKNELAKARKEAQEIIRDSKKQAEVEATDIIAKAKEQAKKAAESERASVEGMIEEARKTASKQLKDLVTATTAEVLKNGLSEADQKKIIESQLAIIKKADFS